MGEGRAAKEERALDSADHGTGVPAGYRHTEVGVIPDDWAAMTVREIAPLQRGFDLPTQQVRTGPYPVVYSNGVLRYHNRAMARAPGVVTGRSGTIGKVHFVDKDYWPHNTALWVTTYLGNDPKFIYYFYARLGLKRFLSGSGVPTLNRNDVHEHLTPLPPLPEQRAIAAVLTDVDELIGSLEALIAKKQAIKQAAMLELLTGRTRLPGFGGKWETRRLANHLKFLRHGTNPRSDLNRGGTVEYLHYGDIHASTVALLDPKDRWMPTLTVERAKRLDRLVDGDLVFVDASEDINGVGKSVELKGVRERRVVAGLHTIAVRFSKSVLADGFKAYLQFHPMFLRHLRRLAAGTKVYATNRSHIASAELALPPLPEQRAIATVLSHMDTEIAALEQRLDKTRAIKQGMMQRLLTGSIRLPILDVDTETDDTHDA